MAMTKQEVEQFKELNNLLSQGKMEDQPKTLEFVGGLVANRCYQDEALAKSFRADPDAAMRALASELGVELSGSLKIVACENDEATWHVSVPSQAQLDKLQKTSLSDAQMSAVAGGEIVVLAIVGAVGAGVAGTATIVGTTAGVATKAKKKK